MSMSDEPGAQNPWDERYRRGYVYGTDPNDFLREVADLIPPGPVLCLAEGQGRNAVFLAERGHRVVAVDGSSVAVAGALALALSRGVQVEVVHADLADYVISPDTYSGITAFWAHLPEELRKRVHAAAVRGLRPGGALVLEAYTVAQLKYGKGGPSDPALMMSLEDLKAELAGLEFRIGRELEREVNEGIWHLGQSGVVQVLAFKPMEPELRRSRCS